MVTSSNEPAQPAPSTPTDAAPTPPLPDQRPAADAPLANLTEGQMVNYVTSDGRTVRAMVAHVSRKHIENSDETKPNGFVNLRAMIDGVERYLMNIPHRVDHEIDSWHWGDSDANRSTQS